MKKFFLILFSASVISFFAAAQTSDAIRQYINTYKELAISEEIRTGVPASITLAQGILESQAGRSKLCMASNNHFGIKCKNDWTGATVSYDDDTKGECFRSYSTAEDSYRDHSDFLRNRPNYASLFLLDPTDYVSWAYGLKKSGYATESAYGQMLVKVINENNLHSFTLVALERIKNGEVYYAANGNQGSPVANASLNSSGPSVDNTTQREIPEYKDGDYPDGEFTINQTKVLYVSAGTSLFAVATNNNIAFKSLQEFNNLDNVDILGKDQLIYLEKKPRKSNNKEYHIVAASETIEDIAQKEGVELESLFAYNKMQKGLEPMTGEKVYLRPGKPSYYPKLFAKNSSR